MTKQEQAAIEAAKNFVTAHENADKWARDWASAQQKRTNANVYAMHELALSVGPRTEALMRALLVSAVRGLQAEAAK